MNQLFIYIPHQVTNRHRYIFDFIFKDYMGLDLSYVYDEVDLLENVAILNYSRNVVENSLQFLPDGLLESQEIEKQDLKPVEFKDYKVLFAVDAEEEQWPFDPFSCVFYMISRYEEYLAVEFDQHGRYNYRESISFQLKQLKRPWIDEILVDLSILINARFPSFVIKPRNFDFLATYDIDVPYAFVGRSTWKSALRGLQQYFIGQTNINSWISTILKVKRGKQRDPYDSYDFLKELQSKYQFQSKYFFLLSNKGKHNPSIDPQSDFFKKLVGKILETSIVGVHPSYHSSEDEKILSSECELLSKSIGKTVTDSRQHFLRMKLPDTWVSLSKKGIRDDYSMGYAEISGFRAGISISYPAFDLIANKELNLWVHPFCWMDATYRYYQKDSSDQTILSETIALIDHVRKVKGRFVTIFHNDNFTDWNNQRNFSKIYMTILAAIFED